jgi:hypothetical protein
MPKIEQLTFNFENRKEPFLTPDDIFEHCNEELLRKFLKIEDRRFEKNPPLSNQDI